MLRLTTVSFLLAGGLLCAACGGGSKSTDTTTTPVASTAEEPVGSTHETVPSETGTEAERQDVAGTTEGTGTEMGTGSGRIETGTGTTGTETGMTAEPQALAPPNVLAMLAAASEHEIAASRLALEKSKNAGVKKFARMMVDQHGQMLAGGEKLATKMSISPEPNDKVESLRSDSQAALERLRGLEGAELDRAYIDLMVEDHEKVLSLIDDEIKPVATGEPDLLAMIEKDRPKIEKHLGEAKKLQTRLNK
jgi:putative membrane protein